MKASLWAGLSTNLPETINPGALYFLVDTGEIYFDYDATHRRTVGGAQSNWLATSGVSSIANKPEHLEAIEIIPAEDMDELLENETWEQDTVYLVPEPSGQYSFILPVTSGGTGADNATDARSNLGVVNITNAELIKYLNGDSTTTATGNEYLTASNLLNSKSALAEDTMTAANVTSVIALANQDFTVSYSVDGSTVSTNTYKYGQTFNVLSISNYTGKDHWTDGTNNYTGGEVITVREAITLTAV